MVKPRVYVRPLKYALAASTVNGSGKGSANVGAAYAPLVPATARPLPASAVVRVTGSYEKLTAAYPNASFSPTGTNPFYEEYAGWVAIKAVGFSR